MDYANDETMQKAFSNGFSFEVLYKPTNTNNVCHMSAQESGGCGIGQASGGLIQFYCHIGGSYKVLKSNVKAKANHYYHVVTASIFKDKGPNTHHIDGGTCRRNGRRKATTVSLPHGSLVDCRVGGDAPRAKTPSHNLSGDVGSGFAHACLREKRSIETVAFPALQG